MPEAVTQAPSGAMRSRPDLAGDAATRDTSSGCATRDPASGCATRDPASGCVTHDPAGGCNAGQTAGVLVTRPAADGATTAARLHARGYAPVLAPLLEIVRLPATLPPPNTLQAILVTSPRALAAIGTAYHGVPLLAVGDATAAGARRAGHVRVLSAAGNAAALLALAQAHCAPQGGVLLLLSGAGDGVALASALAQRFRVEQLFVYAALPAAILPAPASAALRSGRLAAALFFSAATARAFATLAEAACLRDTVSPVVALAISAETAEALAPLPWRAVRVALRPNQNELLDLLL